MRLDKSIPAGDATDPLDEFHKVPEYFEVHILLGSKVLFILRPGHVDIYSIEVDRCSAPV